MSKYVPKELVKKAKEIDLLTYFMNYNPSELVKKGIGTYSLKTHDSVIISNGLWHRFSTNEGGKTALDYLMKVEKMSLQEAVKSILNMEIVKYIVPKEELKEKRQIVIPIKANTNKQAIDYLKNRGIDEEIIQECVDKKLIYQEDKTNNIDTTSIDKEIRDLEKQRNRIKDLYIKGIVEIDDFKEDYKLIEDKLANLESKKLELVNLETFNYSPHELLAQRDLEKEKMIRLDTLNTVLKTKWNGMDKSEKQEFISKFIDTIEIKKDSKGNLILEKINFRNGFIRQLVKFYDAGIFDVAVPVMVDNEEKCIKGGRMNEEQLDKYLSKMNEHFETSFYEMYETIDEETNEVILEYQPKENEKIIRFVAISSKEKFPITVDNVKDKYGIISYKTNKLLEN